MILHIHSYASYLSISHAPSRVGGLCYCGYKTPNADRIKWFHPQCSRRHQKWSAAESEVGAYLQNAQSGAPLRFNLVELSHQQHAKPLRTDNSTAFGIVNETIKQKRSKAMDMRYHWLTHRVRKKQFDVYCLPGKDNIGYYHTKHQAVQHHKDMRPLILHQANSLNVLYGCVKLL
jgi:hypothetical protein